MLCSYRHAYTLMLCRLHKDDGHSNYLHHLCSLLKIHTHNVHNCKLKYTIITPDCANLLLEDMAIKGYLA